MPINAQVLNILEGRAATGLRFAFEFTRVTKVIQPCRLFIVIFVG
jgi:hypothetical protein